MALVYTNIQHKFRKSNNLSCNEYVLADMIYQLSVSPLSRVKGWCYMTKVKMADELGLSKQSILNLIDSLCEKGLIERDIVTSFLKTSDKWNIVYFTEGKESLPDGKESLPKPGKESLPYNNSSYKAINKNKKPKKEIVIYRAFKHLKISVEDFDKLVAAGYSQTQVDDILDAIENHKKNTSYVSLYLTAKKWLKRGDVGTDQTQSRARQIINLAQNGNRIN